MKINKKQKVIKIAAVINTLLILLFIISVYVPSCMYTSYTSTNNDFINLFNIIMDKLRSSFFMEFLILGYMYSLLYILYKKRSAGKIFLSLFLSFLLYLSLVMPFLFLDHGKAKPAIYLYPKSEIDISVKVKVDGILKKVIPEYNNGWNVRVKPNGQMKVIGGNSQITYDYLFYESSILNIILSEKGWIIKNNKEELSKFFNKYLYKIGLNKNEADEFIDFWIPALTDRIKEDFIKISLTKLSDLEKYSTLIINPKPDSILRVDFIFSGINKERNIMEPKIKEFERKGYYAVEWGGSIE